MYVELYDAGSDVKSYSSKMVTGDVRKSAECFFTTADLRGRREEMCMSVMFVFNMFESFENRKGQRKSSERHKFMSVNVVMSSTQCPVCVGQLCVVVCARCRMRETPCDLANGLHPSGAVLYPRWGQV